MAHTIQTAPSGIAERLIRCSRTQQYWNQGQWSPDPKSATVFNDAIEAVQESLSHDLTNVELVLCAPHTRVEYFSTQLR